MLFIYNKISDYIIVLNNNGKIVFCTESFLNRLSYNQDEILKLNISKIITNGYNNIPKGSEEANKTLEFHAKSNEIAKIN